MSLAEFAGDTAQKSDDLLLPTMPREVMEGEEDYGTSVAAADVTRRARATATPWPRSGEDVW